jgi:Ala-tRNA(Pro) deacylase
MVIADTVKNYLAENHVAMELVPHPKTYSTHDSAAAAHVREDHIAKAVIVKDDQGYVMVVIPGNHWLKLEALQKEAGRDLQLADEQEMQELFRDCKMGAIPPLGLAYNIETFLDKQLTTLANIYFEAGDHEHLVHIKGEDLDVLYKGVRQGYFSHNQ